MQNTDPLHYQNDFDSTLVFNDVYVSPIGKKVTEPFAYIGSVIWYGMVDVEGGWQRVNEVQVEDVCESDLCFNPHYDWRHNPEVAATVGYESVCYVCSESHGEWQAAGIFMDGHVVWAHSGCASAAVTAGKAEWW